MSRRAGPERAEMGVGTGSTLPKHLLTTSTSRLRPVAENSGQRYLLKVPSSQPGHIGVRRHQGGAWCSHLRKARGRQLCPTSLWNRDGQLAHHLTLVSREVNFHSRAWILTQSDDTPRLLREEASRQRLEKPMLCLSPESLVSAKRGTPLLGTHPYQP